MEQDTLSRTQDALTTHRPPVREHRLEDRYLAAPITTFSARLHHRIDAVKPLWRRMQRDGVCTAYQAFDWANRLTTSVLPAENAELLIVEIRDGASQRPLMLLPMILRRQRLMRVIAWLDFGVCDYACPVLAPGLDLSPAACRAAWRAVRSVLPDADLILIDGIPPDVFGTINPLAQIPNARPSSRRAFGIELHGDPASLLTRLCEASFVRDMGKAGRRLARAGKVEFVVADDAEAASELFEVLLAQRLRRFRELGRADLLATDHFVTFYRHAAQDGVATGAVRLFGVSVDGDWIATAYGLVHDGTFHGTLLAMGDERWRKASPGLYLISEIIRWAGQQGLSYFDMTVGSLAYKAMIGAQARNLLEITEALSVRGHMFLAARHCALSSREWLQQHPRTYDRIRALRRQERRLRTWANGTIPSRKEGHCG